VKQIAKDYHAEKGKKQLPQGGESTGASTGKGGGEGEGSV